MCDRLAVTTPTVDMELIKCGEVYAALDSNIVVFCCMYCQRSCRHVPELLRHVQMEHTDAASPTDNQENMLYNQCCQSDNSILVRTAAPLTTAATAHSLSTMLRNTLPDVMPALMQSNADLSVSSSAAALNTFPQSFNLNAHLNSEAMRHPAISHDEQPSPHNVIASKRIKLFDITGTSVKKSQILLCNYCEKSFTSKNGLKFHMKRMHADVTSSSSKSSNKSSSKSSNKSSFKSSSNYSSNSSSANSTTQDLTNEYKMDTYLLPQTLHA